MTQPAKRIPRWLTIDLLVIVISLDRDRDRDCSLASNLNRIGSDSYPVLPKLVHPDCRLSERFGSHNIANQRRSLVCVLRRETLGSIQPPAPAPRAFNLVGARKQELPGAKLLGTLWM